MDRGLVENRSRAEALVLAGKVRVGDGDSARLDRKPGELVAVDVALEVAPSRPYVSRGGYKLTAGLDTFAIDPTDRVCLDVGASTGGFTDVLLQRGASRVYALDVGRGQLAESLRQDARVVSMERTNARTLTGETLPEPISLATIDVSFISLARVLGPVVSTFGPDGGDIVTLVKPQFEAARDVAKGGVVRDPAVHREVLERMVRHAATDGTVPRDVCASPITGPEGNREFLLWIEVGPARAAGGRPGEPSPALIERIAVVTAP